MTLARPPGHNIRPHSAAIEAAHEKTGSAAMTEPTEPLVIDVDTGIDDALALLYACAHEEAQILGVSTVVVATVAPFTTMFIAVSEPPSARKSSPWPPMAESK